MEVLGQVLVESGWPRQAAMMMSLVELKMLQAVKPKEALAVSALCSRRFGLLPASPQVVSMAKAALALDLTSGIE